MSLIEELGVEYSNDNFTGALILNPVTGNPAVIQYVDDGAVGVRDIMLKGPEEHRVPHDAIKGWSALAFPLLGYRQQQDFGALIYGTRRNTVRRGLHLQDIRWEIHDVSMAMYQYSKSNYENFIYGDNRALIREIMAPTYTSFKDGLPAILAGEIPFFALSADFAVAPHSEIEGAEILYRRRRIGTISPRGDIAMNINNNHITYLWNKEASNGK